MSDWDFDKLNAERAKVISCKKIITSNDFYDREMTLVLWGVIIKGRNYN